MRTSQVRATSPTVSQCVYASSQLFDAGVLVVTAEDIADWLLDAGEWKTYFTQNDISRQFYLINAGLSKGIRIEGQMFSSGLGYVVVPISAKYFGLADGELLDPHDEAALAACMPQGPGKGTVGILHVLTGDLFGTALLQRFEAWRINSGAGKVVTGVRREVNAVEQNVVGVGDAQELVMNNWPRLNGDGHRLHVNSGGTDEGS